MQANPLGFVPTARLRAHSRANKMPERPFKAPPPSRRVRFAPDTGLEPTPAAGLEPTTEPAPPAAGLEPGLEPTPAAGLVPAPEPGLEPTPAAGLEPRGLRRDANFFGLSPDASPRLEPSPTWGSGFEPTMGLAPLPPPAKLRPPSDVRSGTTHVCYLGTGDLASGLVPIPLQVQAPPLRVGLPHKPAPFGGKCPPPTPRDRNLPVKPPPPRPRGQDRHWGPLAPGASFVPEVFVPPPHTQQWLDGFGLEPPPPPTAGASACPSLCEKCLQPTSVLDGPAHVLQQ